MLQVDLSALSGQELRQLLDTTRSRGQADLSYQILQEMEARRAREPGPKPLFKRRREPRVVELNLGDPLEPEADEDDDVPSLSAARAPEPPLEMPRPDPGPPPRRIKSIGFAAGIVVGVAGGIAVGLGVAEVSFHTDTPEPTPPIATLLSPPQPPAPAPIVTAQADPPPAPPPEAEPAPTEVADNAAPSDAVENAKEILSAPAEQKAPEEKPAVTLASNNACAGKPTPADRIICADAELQRLQKELRDAYARALAAHEDRDLLREHQLAWRDARNDVDDPVKLTRLYEQRIRKLDAATADAERQR